MEKTTEAGERTGIVEEEVAVKSAVKDVLVADIPDIPVKEMEEEGDVLVMVGAEIVDTVNELSKKPREGSGLVSIPTVLEEELQLLLTENSTVEEKVAMKKDTRMDDKAVMALTVEAVEDKEPKTEKNAGFDGEKKEKSEKVDGGDGAKKKKAEDGSKKEKKDKKEEKKDKKDKDEKKKEKKEKKSKKSDVDRIRKKLEKIHSKIERILAKKEEYLQRLAEAEEKERQEKERVAAEEAAKQERSLATATKSSSERNGDALSGEPAEEAAKQERDLATTAKSSSERNGDALSGEARDDDEAVQAAVKQVGRSEQSSGKQLDENISGPISVSNTDTIEKDGSKQPTTGVTDNSVLDQSSARA